MAGRPRTKHRKVKALLTELYDLWGRLEEIMPRQYNASTIGDSSLPHDDLGRAWRRADRGLTKGVEALEWLENLLEEKAKQADAVGVADGATLLDAESDDEASTVAEHSEPERDMGG